MKLIPGKHFICVFLAFCVPVQNLVEESGYGVANGRIWGKKDRCITISQHKTRKGDWARERSIGINCEVKLSALINKLDQP